MADERMIVIKIESTSTETKPKPTDEEGKVNVDYNSIMHPLKTLENKTIGKTIALNMAWQQAKEIAVQSIDFQINRYATLKEDYLTQNTYNNVKTTIKRTTGLFSTMTGGAITGMQVAGPYGAIAGVLIAGIGYGISDSIALKSRLSGYYQDLNSSNANTAFSRQRAGLSNDGRGTEN